MPTPLSLGLNQLVSSCLLVAANSAQARGLYPKGHIRSAGERTLPGTLNNGWWSWVYNCPGSLAPPQIQRWDTCSIPSATVSLFGP